MTATKQVYVDVDCSSTKWNIRGKVAIQGPADTMRLMYQGVGPIAVVIDQLLAADLVELRDLIDVAIAEVAAASA